MTFDLDTFLFGYYPYLALVVLFVGSIIRFDREQYTWKAGSSQLLSRKLLMVGSVLFHVGILVIFLGHFAGLLTPIWVFDAIGIGHGDKQLLAMVAGGIAGVMCFAGLLMLIYRRLFDARVRVTSTFSDVFILILLFFQVLLGLLTIPESAKHLDGEEMLKFMNWAQHIFTFRGGAADFVRDVSPIFKAHLVLGCTILLVFPFTRLVHVLSAPIWYVFRKGYQVVRTKKA
jgi:nitrate reductase gamma subunit